MNVGFDPLALARWCDGHWTGDQPAALHGITSDSRDVQPGQLYIALQGERFDGHDFVAEAAAQGAGAALVEAAQRDRWPVPPLPLLVVADTRQGLTALARGHRARCQGTVTGITGSVGKTSVKEMTADILLHAGRVARTFQNWNNELGVPLSVLRMPPDARFGVFEVGMNHPGELAPLCALLQPDLAVLTPIGPVHLEFFPDVAAIAHEKGALLDALAADGTAVLSVDDPCFDVLAEHARDRRLVRLSFRDSGADFYGEWRNDASGSFNVTERATGLSTTYPLPLPGRYVADNALRAIAVARTFGLEPSAIAAGLMAYRPPAMRWVSRTINAVTFINDAYNANPLSMRAAADALQGMAVPGRRWLVLAGMFELGDQAVPEHRALGAYLARSAWGGLVTVGRWGDEIAAGARTGGMPDTAVFPCADIAAAAACLRGRVMTGDTVLLKASRGERLEALLPLMGECED